jgi:cytidine deaminase
VDVSEKDLDLLRIASLAMDAAHSPYSGIRVGAAVRTADGQVYPGCNLENASLGLTMCAERVALGNAAAHGSRDVEAVAITSNHPLVASPCGACRQVLLELAPRARILFGQEGRVHRLWESPRDLLPDSFDGSWKA